MAGWRSDFKGRQKVTRSIVADLFDLMVSLDGLSPAEIEARGRELYSRQYLNHGHYGIHATHDGETLVFHKSQFDHAFFTTSDRICLPERKDIVRRASIERILWIEQLVSGECSWISLFRGARSDRQTKTAESAICRLQATLCCMA
jgi:hypothetical protein